MIPRFKPHIDSKELISIFRRNKGAVERFEKEFAARFGAKEAVAFPYGRSALYTFFQAINLQNDEIIMPAYTCSVVAHAIALSGNIPRFVDISLFDYNMDLDLLANTVTEKTRAIVATHLFGYPQDLDVLESIVADAEAKYGHKIWLIQDCAHSFGATWKNRLVGTSGDVALYALNISKMITSIFGGILTLQDAGLAAKIREKRDSTYRISGLIKSCMRRLYFLSSMAAFNENIYGVTWWLQERTSILNKLTKSYHLDQKIHFPPNAFEKMLDVEAMVGLEQLKKYDEIVKARRETALWYDKNLNRHQDWEFPPIVEGATYSHYVVRVPNREKILNEYSKRGINLGELIQYSIPETQAYQEYSKGASFPQAKLSSLSTINFPLNADIKEKDLTKIAKIGRYLQ